MPLLLRYKGPAVDDGTMDVYEAAANMVAFSNYVVLAAKRVYGEQVEVRAEVQGFQEGSFITDLLFHVAGAGATIWSAYPVSDVKGVLTVVRESLGLYRFLKGEAPRKTEHVNDNHVQVTNNNGQIINVQADSLFLTLDPKAGKAAEQFVHKALSKPGFSGIEVSSEDAQVVSATSAEAAFFRPIGVDTEITDQTVKLALTIEKPSLKDGDDKWHMWDGDQSSAYQMEDKEFLARIDHGEPFRKGDVLECDVRIVQTTGPGGLKTRRSITMVRHHHQRGEQSSML